MSRTGAVSNAKWIIADANRVGEAPKNYVATQLSDYEDEWHLLAKPSGTTYITTGTVQVGLMLRSGTAAGIAFTIRNYDNVLPADHPTDEDSIYWEMYTVELNYDDQEIVFAKWIAGVRSVILSKAYTLTRNQPIWVGVDLGEIVSSRKDIYVSLNEGDLITNNNIVFSISDTSINPGGTVGLVTYKSNTQFFNFVAGSPSHAKVADIAHALDGTITASATKRVRYSNDDDMFQWSEDGTNWTNVGAEGGGGGAGVGYVHEQTSAAATWSINHGLGTENVSVAVWDSSGELVNADVVIVDSDNLTITHSSAITGKAIVLGATAFTTPITTSEIDSGSATANQALLADGSGGADWETITPAIVGAIPEAASSTDQAIVRWDGTGGDTLQDSAVIVTDAGDVSNGGQGIFQRIVDSGYTVTDHFRSGTIPSGYTWQTYSPFVAPTPAYIGSDWIRAGTGTAPFYLAKTISTLASAYSDMSIMPGQNAYIGWRVDDASNTNWSMFQCREYAGEYYFLLDDSDGVSLSYGPFFWQGPVTMRFFTIVSGSTHQHRLYRLNTQISGQSGLMLNTTTYRSWTPARSGLYINPNGG